MARLKTLREAQLEVSIFDSRTFSTMHPLALQHLFQEGAEQGPSFRPCVEHVAMRLSTLLATLGENPSVRYHPPPPVSSPPPPPAAALVAQALQGRMGALASALGGSLPSPGSCDLLVVDRTLDPVGPAVHPWTYEAMVHDLLVGDGRVYEYMQVTGDGSRTRQGRLGEEDPLFAAIRHLFIGDAST